MMSFSAHLILYTLMITAAVGIGSCLSIFFGRSQHQMHFILALSAGLMLGAALIHLLPSSFELMGKSASVWVLVGFLFLYVIKKYLTIHICELLECENHLMGFGAFVGISIHALTDGIALGSGLMVEGLGFVVFLTIFFHKLPEAFALTRVLVHEKFSWTKIVLLNILLMLMVPLGAYLVDMLVGMHDVHHYAGLALALSAGTFLHIALSDLLPHVHEHAEKHSPIYIAFVLGTGFMWALSLMEKFVSL